MKPFILFTFFFTLAKVGIAQIDIFPIDSIPEATNVVIYKDPRLDILDARPPIVAKAELEEKALKAEKAEAAVKAGTLYKPIVSASGKKKVTGSIYTTKGFRVVIYNGSDRAKAMEAKNLFSRSFGSQRSYMSYNVPSYKIKVGDFEDKKEANTFLRRVGAVFPTSFIVPDIVTVKNINVTE